MTSAPSSEAHVDLALTGMTVRPCASRIEKKLNRLDGVSASVNFATEKAAVDFDPAVVAPDDLVATVEAMGYGARLPAPAAAEVAGPAGSDAEPAELAALRQRLCCRSC